MAMLSCVRTDVSLDGTNPTKLDAVVLVAGTIPVDEKHAVISRAFAQESPLFCNTSVGGVRLSNLCLAVGQRVKNTLFLYIPSAQDEGYSKSLSHARGLLANLTAEGIPVGATIHFHDVSQKRMTQAAQDDLKVLCSVVAEYSSYERVVFATTDWHSDSITELRGSSRERELKDNYWKRLIQHGATVVRVGYRAKGKAPGGSELDKESLASIVVHLLASCADRMDADVDPRRRLALTRLYRCVLRRIAHLLTRRAWRAPTMEPRAIATPTIHSVAGTPAREGLPD